MVQKLWPMLKLSKKFFKVGNRSRSKSQVKIFCMSGKPLSQGTYMPNIKALSQMVQKFWPMLKFSNQQTNQKTNKQTGQKQYVPAIATGDIKCGLFLKETIGSQ